MIKNWIKKTINCIDNDIDNDVNVDIARENYQKYQDELEKQRKDYIKSLYNKIRYASRHGCKSIETANLLENFMTYKFLMELKEHFEQRGFDVREESSRSGIITSWLRISWE